MTNRATWEYYDKRSLQRPPGVGNAVTYWQGLGVPCSAEDVGLEADEVVACLRSLPPTTFLDVGCGPGTFTGTLPGWGVALDQSFNALARVVVDHPRTPPVRGDAMALPFCPRSFGRALVSHLYGLLQPREARALLGEVRRIAGEVVILDAGRPAGVAAEEWQQRTLPDGSEHQVFRRHFRADELAAEVGGRVVFAGSFYVIVLVGMVALDGGLDTPAVHTPAPNV